MRSFEYKHVLKNLYFLLYLTFSHFYFTTICISKIRHSSEELWSPLKLSQSATLVKQAWVNTKRCVLTKVLSESRGGRRAKPTQKTMNRILVSRQTNKGTISSYILTSNPRGLYTEYERSEHE